MFNKKFFANYDIWLVVAVIVLSIFGIICIGSAVHINQGEELGTFYKQIIFFILGIGIMVFMSLVDVDLWGNLYIPIYVFNLILLSIVLIIGIGGDSHGASRWIAIGPLTIQPSEFAKIFMIIFTAKLIDKKKDSINNIGVILTIIALAMIPIIMVYKQPSMSACLVLVAILGCQLFAAGLSYKFIAKVAGVVVPVVGFLVWDTTRENPIIADKIFYSHQMDRIMTFINPEADYDSYYQTLKSINAISSGQLSGKGLYQGTLNQLSYLPEPHNDFIFSVIGEEFGFIGCVFVLLLMLFIILRCVYIAMQTENMYHRIIIVGVAAMLSFQTIVNTCVATGLIPNTGMSFPFVSYGGSSMWTSMASIGIVLNIGLKRSRTLFEGG